MARSFNPSISYDDAYIEWVGLQARDAAKVQLYKALNIIGYYLIVVDYDIPIEDRPNYILREFLRQISGRTGLTGFG